jgi:hypothetical protein
MSIDRQNNVFVYYTTRILRNVPRPHVCLSVCMSVRPRGGAQVPQLAAGSLGLRIMAGAPSLLPMQGVDGQREEDQEKEEEEDIVYQSSIPGVQINVTTDADRLNIWARRLQMQWLGEGDAGRNDLDHLNARTKQRVRLQHQKDVQKRSNQIRREIFFWVIWAGLLALVLNSFALGDSFKYSAKVRQEILGESEELLEGVSTREGVWDFIEQTLNPTIFPEDTSDPNYKWRKNTMIGALRLQQTRTQKNVGCKIPKVYDKLIPSCYPSLDYTKQSKESFGRERQFVAEEMPVFPMTEYVYIYDIASDLNISSANQELNELRAQEWLDLESAKLVVLNTHCSRLESAVLGRHSSLPWPPGAKSPRSWVAPRRAGSHREAAMWR